MSEPKNSINPYAAPHVTDPAINEMGDVRLGAYPPRLAPRDYIDVLLGMAIGVPASVIVYGVPILLIAVLGAPAVLIPVSIFSILAAAILAMLAGIKKITLTEQGIQAQRSILPSIDLSWTDIVAIRELNRSEALRTAFIAPHRYCSQSLTYRNQFRIDTRGSFIIFPPQNVASFRTTVEALWRGATKSGERRAESGE